MMKICRLTGSPQRNIEHDFPHVLTARIFPLKPCETSIFFNHRDFLPAAWAPKDLRHIGEFAALIKGVRPRPWLYMAMVVKETGNFYGMHSWYLRYIYGICMVYVRALNVYIPNTQNHQAITGQKKLTISMTIGQ